MSAFLKNIPNALSGYRLLSFPVLLYLIYSNHKDWYILLLSINLITDILDGLIARVFKLQTEFGARLDSLADIGTMILAFLGLFHFYYEFIETHAIGFIALISSYLIPQLISFLKFKRFPSLHLYSNKINGYIQGIFIFTFFNFGYTPWYFYFMLATSFIAYAEEFVCVLYMKEMKSNVKTSYHLMK